MNYWFFTVTQKRSEGEVIAAEEILKQRLAYGFWGLGERTPNRRSLQKGDQVVFYLGVPFMAFAASATLASVSFQIRLPDSHSFSGTDIRPLSVPTFSESLHRLQ